MSNTETHVNNAAKLTKLIHDWRSAFNQEPPIETLKNIKQDRLIFCLDLIKEEANETLLAAKEKNEIEIIDGLGDTFWVIMYGLLEVGYNPNFTLQKKLSDQEMVIEVAGKDALESVREMGPEFLIKPLERLLDLEDHTRMVLEKDGISKEKGLSFVHFLTGMLCDLLEMAIIYGIDMVTVISAIYDSNMTKLVTEDQMEDVRSYYKEKDIEVRFEESLSMKGNYIIFNTNTGKILKPSWFEKPYF